MATPGVASRAVIFYVADEVEYASDGDDPLLKIVNDIGYINKELVEPGCCGLLSYCEAEPSDERQILKGLERGAGDQEQLRISAGRIFGIVTNFESENILLSKGIRAVQRIELFQDEETVARTVWEKLGIDDNGIHESECDMAVVVLKRQKSNVEDCGIGENESNPMMRDGHQAMFRWVAGILARMDRCPYFKNCVFVSLQIECSNVDVVRLMESQSDMSSIANTVRPPQSFSTHHSKQIPLDRNKIAISVNRLAGATRRDAVKTLSVDQFAFCGGNKCILIERLLYEIAYKTGLANKYGA